MPFPPILDSIVPSFLQLIVENGPSLLVGLVLAAVLLALIRHVSWVETTVGRIGKSLFLALFMGGLLPGCALSALPLAMVLRKQGAPLGNVAGFLIMAALLGPGSLVLTLFLLGPDWLLARIVLPLVAVGALGLALNAWTERHPQRDVEIVAEKASASMPAPCGSTCGCEPAAPQSKGILVGLVKDTWRLGRILVPLFCTAMLLVAILSHVLPEDWWERHLVGTWYAYLLAVAVGIPAYVCEGGEVPLTLAMVTAGVGVGPAFTFLQASVGTCLPTILAAPKILGAKATVLYVLFWLCFAVASGWLAALWI